MKLTKAQINGILLFGAAIVIYFAIRPQGTQYPDVNFT